jgi:PAS domain S-box-containing protein
MREGLRKSWLAWRFPKPPQSVGGRYAIAMAAFLVSFFLRAALQPWLFFDRGIIIFLPAIILTTFLAGPGPSIVTAILSGLSVWYFFMPVHHSFHLIGAVDLATFVFGSGTSIILVHWLRTTITEVEAERAKTEALARQREILATIVEASRDAIWGWTPDGTITSWNSESERMLGYVSEEIIGKSILTLVPSERLQAAREIITKVGHGTYYGPLETVRIRKNGRPLHVELSASPIRDSAGAVVAAATICRDITERKHAEETEKTLVREIQHRSNNLLAIVQSIAHRSLSGDRSLAEARQALEARLQTLARINRQLTQSDWSGLSLKEIIRQELEPFVAQVLVDGIDIALSPQQAQNFSLVLHELATNAAKYGALSNGTGTIGVSWTVAGTEQNRILKFRWQEKGGPPVTRPTRTGFGGALLNIAFGDVHFDYAAEGISCEFDVPLESEHLPNSILH